MAAITGAVIMAGASAYSANRQRRGAADAARAQREAGEAANAETRAAREQMRADLMRYMDAGQTGLNGLTQLANGDYTAFQNSPDYLFAQQQMGQGLDRSAAARGGLFGGGHQADLMAHQNGLASQNLGNYRNSLQFLANMGQNSAAMTGQAGMQAANQIGNNLWGIGNARAGQAQANADASSNFAGSLAGIFNGYMGNMQAKQSSYTQPGQGAEQFASFGNNPDWQQQAWGQGNSGLASLWRN